MLQTFNVVNRVPGLRGAKRLLGAPSHDPNSFLFRSITLPWIFPTLELHFTSRQGTMAPKLCALCAKSRAILKRPKTGQQICKECFFYVFETEVHNTITQAQLFKPGDRVAIGASGGKGALPFLILLVAYSPVCSPW